MTEPTLAELLERHRERKTELALEWRRLAGEYALLEQYDIARVRLGHDYGAGQRAGELRRRRGRVEELASQLGELEPINEAELAAAYDRVGRPRHRRAFREAELYGSAGANRTAAAWERMRARYGGGDAS